MALPLSDDLRAQIIRFFENHDDYTQQEIADEFGISRSCVEKLLQRWRATGSSAALPHAGGRVSALQAHEARLKELVAAQPDCTLTELREQLAQERQLALHESSICRALQRLRLPRKKSPK